MTEGELRGAIVGKWRLEQGWWEFDWRRADRGADLGDEVAAAELHRAPSGGSGAVAGDDDADKVGRVGGRKCHCSRDNLLLAHFTQGLDRLRERKLLTLEAGDKAAAAHDAARFKAPEHAEQLAPAGHGGLA